MDITDVTYPAFQANQVLTSAHLNDLFGYLDEQQRLTRADLVGIGIVCGLEVTGEASGTVHLSRGVGVTSQGYLVVEPEDLSLSWAKSYVLPTGHDYPPFLEPGPEPRPQVDLWELFGDDDEPGATPLATTVPTLTDKAVVLFLELHRAEQRTCAPSSCDDRGARVTATVRRLLVDVADLDTMQQVLQEAGIEPLPDPAERLGLPDLRMPRFDVPASSPVHTAQVLRAFQRAFSQDKLVTATATALSGLYQAFRPLLVDTYPDDPFAGLAQRFDFLETTPTTAAQVRALPTYWDLFDDLLAGYEEARWAGADLACACCPPEELFPRHLVAGVLDPTSHDPDSYRHHFLPSPAVGDCADRTREFRTLVDRLVAMLAGFTTEPPAKGVRATPSRLGGAPLSTRAVPAHYDLTGTPPLYRLWDPVKTARRRAHHNLGYRAEEYVPPAPAFVTDPLRFDLGANDFLRIEGHLGKDVREVLDALQLLRTTRRLPIEVVALRTGEYDEKQDVDPDRQKCRFRDLDTLYEVLKAGQVDFLVDKAKYFYTLPVETRLADDVVKPTLRLLATYDPGFVAEPGTLGRLMESSLTWKRGTVRPRTLPVPGAPDLPGQALALVSAMSQLSTELADDVHEVDFAVVVDRNRAIAELAEQMAAFARDDGFDLPGLRDQLEEVASRGRLDQFETLAREYRRRMREARQAQFLSHFLARHPGVQHGAGVPLGGTYVLVYHGPTKGTPTPDVRGPRDIVGELPGDLGLDLGPGLDLGLTPDRRRSLDRALDRLRDRDELADDPDLRLLFRTLTGREAKAPVTLARGRDSAYLEAVKGLADGTVVADLYLPYACGSDCPPILCLPPTPPLTAEVTVGCTGPDQHAEVTLKVEGAEGRIEVRVDDGDFTEAGDTLLLAVGQHTLVVRDGSGRTSAPLPVSVPGQLGIGEPTIDVDEQQRIYRVSFEVHGGTPPYTAAPGQIDGTAYTSPDVPIDAPLTVRISDGAGCTLERTVEAQTVPCDVPCAGDAERWGYRFWVPQPTREAPLLEYSAEVHAFVVIDETGQQVDLRDRVADILGSHGGSIEAGEFPDLVKEWLESINRTVADAVGSDQWFRLEYEPARRGAPNGTLVVDRLRCLDFAFELQVAYLREPGEAVGDLMVSYRPEGTVVADPRAEDKVLVPPANGSVSNRCRPEEPPVPLCKEVGLRLEIVSEGAVPELVLAAELSGPDAGRVTALVWEVQDGVPPLYAGEKIVVTQVEPPEPPRKRIRLTAYTERGCTVTLERVINVHERQ